jgi:hypothetical protein
MLENSFIIDKFRTNNKGYIITANNHTLQSLATRNFRGEDIVNAIKNIANKIEDYITYGIILKNNKKLLVIKKQTLIYIITGLSSNMFFKRGTKTIKL